jgi:hypothetical protein
MLTLLGLALIGPAALPAGGGERRQPELRRRHARDPLIATGPLSLLCAPDRQAPSLARLEPGTSLELLGRWWGPSGLRWLRVQVSEAAPGSPRRGWLVG